MHLVRHLGMSLWLGIIKVCIYMQVVRHLGTSSWYYILASYAHEINEIFRPGFETSRLRVQRRIDDEHREYRIEYLCSLPPVIYFFFLLVSFHFSIFSLSFFLS